MEIGSECPSIHPKHSTGLRLCPAVHVVEGYSLSSSDFLAVLELRGEAQHSAFYPLHLDPHSAQGGIHGRQIKMLVLSGKVLVSSDRPLSGARIKETLGTALGHVKGPWQYSKEHLIHAVHPFPFKISEADIASHEYYRSYGVWSQ